MHCIVRTLASVSCAVLLSSCLSVAGAPVSGRTHDVSVIDIKQAVIAARNAPEKRAGVYKVYSIEVRNRDEIYLYTTPDGGEFDYIKREKNGWRYQSEGVVLKHFVPASPY
jgi:hypothetical protein